MDRDESGGDDPFTYDYATLSTGGLVFAGVIVCLAILLLLSDRMCKRKGSPVVQQE